MTYLILIAAIALLLLVAYSSATEIDYDFRDEYYKHNQYPGYPPPPFNAGMPYFPQQQPYDPAQWYQLETSRMRTNFNNGFKAGLFVIFLVVIAYIWGRYF